MGRIGLLEAGRNWATAGTVPHEWGAHELLCRAEWLRN